jgi:hypothetical protein
MSIQTSIIMQGKERSAMKPKSLTKIIVFMLVVLLATGCSPKKTDDPKTDPNLLFEDTFQRADANTAGSEWQEVKMRGGTGNSTTTMESGDSPWSIKGNALSYEGIGNGTYTEDYIETVKEFPIENTRVEFEIRGTASTTKGYVGPAAFWAPAASLRIGTFRTIGDKDPVIGIQASYGWESAGTRGMAYYLDGSINKLPDRMFPGINGTDFVKHAIILKDGKMTHEVNGELFAEFAMGAPIVSGTKRHFSFDVRYYDNGIPFKVEIRNLKITVIK